MAECLVSESARVRDGAATGLPGAKAFRAPSLKQAQRCGEAECTTGQGPVLPCDTRSRAGEAGRPWCFLNLLITFCSDPLLRKDLFYCFFAEILGYSNGARSN